MTERKLPVIAGRGSQIAPLGRFAKLEFERDAEALDHELDDVARHRGRSYVPHVSSFLRIDLEDPVEAPDVQFFGFSFLARTEEVGGPFRQADPCARPVAVVPPGAPLHRSVLELES